MFLVSKKCRSNFCWETINKNKQFRETQTFKANSYFNKDFKGTVVNRANNLCKEAGVYIFSKNTFSPPPSPILKSFFPRRFILYMITRSAKNTLKGRVIIHPCGGSRETTLTVPKNKEENLTLCLGGWIVLALLLSVH